MTLWQNPPHNPKVDELTGQWTGRDFIITHVPSQQVILRISGDTAQVSANLPDNSITPSKLAGGLGNSQTLDKASAGAITILPAASYDRTFLLNLEVTEDFADAGDTQTTFEIGNNTTADTYLATGALTNAALATRIPLGGILEANEPLLVTAVAATGAGTGAIRVATIAVR